MQKVRIKKGFRFRMAGEPSDELTPLPAPKQVAILPERIPHIKPRLHVAEGDEVKIGSPLFEDKGDPRLRFLSPGGGKIERIQFGPRRVLQAIVIDRAADNEPEITFDAIDEPRLEAMAREALVKYITDNGMWWVFRELPFRNLPDPDATPPMILVGLDAKEPFQPAPSVYLKGKEAQLRFGLKVLGRLSANNVIVFADEANQAVLGQCREQLTHTVAGRYPSDDPGAVLYHVKRSASENRAWYIAGQDLILLAQLFMQGRLPLERVVSVAGSGAPNRQHYRTRIGTPLSQLAAPDTLPEEARYVVGGLLRGYTSDPDGFLGLYETALNIVPQGDRDEFLALFKPGFSKPSYSRIFASKLNPRPLVYNCKINGDRRACIACMHCADVCPVDMLPQLVYKAIKAGEVEEYLSLGLLDCVECGLCSYVCPSKIELRQAFIETKAAYAKEQGQKSE